MATSTAYTNPPYPAEVFLQPMYYNITKETAKSLILQYNQGPGTYLLRPNSAADPSMLIVSLSGERGDVVHKMPMFIERDQSGLCQFYFFHMMKFPKLKELLDYYRTNEIHNTSSIELFLLHPLLLSTDHTNVQMRAGIRSVSGYPERPTSSGLQDEFGSPEWESKKSSTQPSAATTITNESPGADFQNSKYRRSSSSSNTDQQSTTQTLPKEKRTLKKIFGFKKKPPSSNPDMDRKSMHAIPRDRNLQHMKCRPPEPLPRPVATSSDNDVEFVYSQVEVERDRFEEIYQRAKDEEVCECGIRIVDSELPNGWKLHLCSEGSTEGQIFFQKGEDTTSWDLPAELLPSLTEKQIHFILSLCNKSNCNVPQTLASFLTSVTKRQRQGLQKKRDEAGSENLSSLSSTTSSTSSHSSSSVTNAVLMGENCRVQVHTAPHMSSSVDSLDSSMSSLSVAYETPGALFHSASQSDTASADSVSLTKGMELTGAPGTISPAVASQLLQRQQFPQGPAPQLVLQPIKDLPTPAQQMTPAQKPMYTKQVLTPGQQFESRQPTPRNASLRPQIALPGQQLKQVVSPHQMFQETSITDQQEQIYSNQIENQIQQEQLQLLKQQHEQQQLLLLKQQQQQQQLLLLQQQQQQQKQQQQQNVGQYFHQTGQPSTVLPQHAQQVPHLAMLPQQTQRSSLLLQQVHSPAVMPLPQQEATLPSPNANAVKQLWPLDPTQQQQHQREQLQLQQQQQYYQNNGQIFSQTGQPSAVLPQHTQQATLSPNTNIMQPLSPAQQQQQRQQLPLQQSVFSRQDQLFHPGEVAYVSYDPQVNPLDIHQQQRPLARPRQVRNPQNLQQDGPQQQQQQQHQKISQEFRQRDRHISQSSCSSDGSFSQSFGRENPMGHALRQQQRQSVVEQQSPTSPSQTKQQQPLPSPSQTRQPLPSPSQTQIRQQQPLPSPSQNRKQLQQQ